MTMILSILGWTSFSLGLLVGTALNLIGQFGNWVILATVVIAWLASGFTHFGWVSLCILTLLAVIGEILEAAASALGASKFGGSKGSAVAAVVGCIAGAILGTPIMPIIGTVIGACLGSFVAAVYYEYVQHEKEVHEALWTGLGAAIGRIMGMMAKLVVGFIMIGIAVWGAF